MLPPSMPLDNLLVRFSKTFLNLALHLKLTQSLNWDTKQLRRTTSHSNGIAHQLSRLIDPLIHPVEALFRSLKAGDSPSHLARILTAAQGHSGDWITAYPIAQVGTRLDDETLRISVALRVGLNVCLAHQCRCWNTVQSDSHYPLSCRFSAGRFPRRCCCCCRPHSTNVLPAESSTRIMWQPTVSPPGGKERHHFVGIRPEFQARKGGW